MARNVKVIRKKTFDGNIQTDPADTLAKAIFDTVNGNTVIAITGFMMGQDPAVIIVYDTA
jgi:hypothetical protein